MLKFMKFMTIGLLVLSGLIATSYTGAYWYTSQNKHIMSFTKSAYFTDTDQNPIAKIKMGKSAVLHLSVRRQPLDCFAMYVVTMKQVDKDQKEIASYQFPPRMTSVVITKETTLEVGATLPIPADVTPGHYTFSQIVFPTCSSITIMPFNPGLFAELDIVR